MTRRFAALVNPSAGKGRAARWAVDALNHLRGAGIEVEELRGRDSRHAAELAQDAAARGVDTLVAVGGDGSVHLALQAVAETPVSLGIIPAGTGNDVARALGLPRSDPIAAADVLVKGHTRSVDAARAGEHWFAGVLAAGFDAKVNARGNRLTWPRGRMRYNLALLAELGVFRPIAYSLVVDGVPWRAEAMLVAVGNGPSYGGGMRITEGAVIDDGLLDVLVVHRMSRLELARVFPKVYAGSHLRHPAVECRRVKRVDIEAAGVVAYADGEALGPLPLSISVTPGALRVIVPLRSARERLIAESPR